MCILEYLTYNLSVPKATLGLIPFICDQSYFRAYKELEFLFGVHYSS
jgi:hypothetical protein